MPRYANVAQMVRALHRHLRYCNPSPPYAISRDVRGLIVGYDCTGCQVTTFEAPAITAGALPVAMFDAFHDREAFPAYMVQHVESIDQLPLGCPLKVEEAEDIPAYRMADGLDGVAWYDLNDFARRLYERGVPKTGASGMGPLVPDNLIDTPARILSLIWDQRIIAISRPAGDGLYHIRLTERPSYHVVQLRVTDDKELDLAATMIAALFDRVEPESRPASSALRYDREPV